MSKTFAILTSGGDSPGMNCAIRAFTRSVIYQGHKVMGIRRGYAGLLDEDIIPLKASSVGNILQRGGTILRSSRCPEFMEEKNRKKAADILKKNKIDGLVVIGGDGSFNGAYKLYSENKTPVIGIPGTIDNDISGTEYTIGHVTAVQTAIEAVDRIRDTAFSHERIFLVEVMGRNSCGLALRVGICTGAEDVLLPDEQVDYKNMISNIERGIARGKNSSIYIVAEGEKAGRSYDIQKTLGEKHKIKAKVCILGHIQRGGSPNAIDRLYASEMGALAANSIINFTEPLVTTYNDGKVGVSPFANCLTKISGKDQRQIELTKMLAI
ncbi:MAG: 6-phosphofructokinase [Halobacteriovoraceae bacterium]|nr:6-phosphofructokinase [Halobacteriovoraceae bacterium]